MDHSSNEKQAAPIPTPAQIKPVQVTPAQVTPAQVKPSVGKPGSVLPSAARAGIAPTSSSEGQPPAPVEESMDPLAVAEAAAFGRVDDEGNVYLIAHGTERVVGQYPGVSADEAMQLYIRRFLDIKANIDLFATRLPNLSAKDIDTSLESITESLTEPAVVGDVAGLESQVKILRERAQVRKDELAAQRAAAREKATAAREEIVKQAEKLAALDPNQVQWKKHGQQLRDLLEEWKQAQRSGMRIDRTQEDALWKRFAAARSTFDRNRRQFFAELDRSHAQAKAAKEAIVKRAQGLSDSTRWGETTAAFHDLMDEWKRAGRAARKDDDALWEKFRAAQDKFFQARAQARAQTEEEFAENLAQKLELLKEAEALLPVTDARQAKNFLYDILDRWDAIGRVPRENLREIENRLQKVEQAIRDADESTRQQQSSGPALAEGFTAQLKSSIAALQKQLADAQAAGNDQEVADLKKRLEAQEAWLAQVSD